MKTKLLIKCEEKVINYMKRKLLITRRESYLLHEEKVINYKKRKLLITRRESC